MTPIPEPTLLPDTPVQAQEGTVGYLAIEDLQHELARAPEPSAALKHSIARAGVLKPIIVQRSNGRYDVKDGLRRLRAAHETGFLNVPCRQLPETIAGDAVTIWTNQHRSPNPVVELQAIERLIEQVGSAERVAEELKVPVQWVRRRLKLLNLVLPLRRAWEKGLMSTATAERASGLPKARQQKLVAALQDGGRLTPHDVREERSAEAQKVAAALPDSLFAGPAADADASVTPIDVLAKTAELLSVFAMAAELERDKSDHEPFMGSSRISVAHLREAAQRHRELVDVLRQMKRAGT